MILKKAIFIIAIIGIAFLFLSCKHEAIIPEQKVCFTTDIQPIINANCAVSGCHDAISHTDGIDLSSYKGILEEIKPGKPYDSDLYEVIRDGEMPPSPRNQLNSEQITLIYTWILQGAKNETCPQQ